MSTTAQTTPPAVTVAVAAFLADVATIPAPTPCWPGLPSATVTGLGLLSACPARYPTTPGERDQVAAAALLDRVGDAYRTVAAVEALAALTPTSSREPDMWDRRRALYEVWRHGDDDADRTQLTRTRRIAATDLDRATRLLRPMSDTERLEYVCFALAVAFRSINSTTDPAHARNVRAAKAVISAWYRGHRRLAVLGGEAR